MKFLFLYTDCNKQLYSYNTLLDIKCIARANCSAFNKPVFLVSQSSLQKEKNVVTEVDKLKRQICTYQRIRLVKDWATYTSKTSHVSSNSSKLLILTLFGTNTYDHISMDSSLEVCRCTTAKQKREKEL